MHPHKFIAVLAICSFNFNVPICPSDCMYLTHVAHFLPEIKFQSQEAEHLHPKKASVDAKILVKLLCLHLCLPNPQFQCHFYAFCFGLCSFIAVYQNTCFVISPGLLVVSIEVILSLVTPEQCSF